MTGLRFNFVVIMALMLASMQFYGTAAQTTHVVGDTFSWNIPSAEPSTYTTRASSLSFSVGDILLFNFTIGFHNVAEVSQAAYGMCTTSNPISIATIGPSRVTLNAPGTHYYVCTVGTHCQIGQKLTINVSATSATLTAPTPTTSTPTHVSPPNATLLTPTPTPTPSTTTATPTSSHAPSSGEASPVSPPTSGQSPSGSNAPSPTDGTTLPPPSPSFAPSFIVVVPFTLFVIALGFFY